MPEYLCEVRVIFEAEDPKDAARQFKTWLEQYADKAGVWICGCDGFRSWWFDLEEME